MANNPDAPWSSFNPVFLGLLIVCGVLSIFFLLYFNRVFASVISYIIRTYTWHRYRIYIDIQALQVSLLGGRVFFIGFRYHGNNETILIQNGHITWSYWLWRVKDVNIVAPRKAAGKSPDGDTENPSNEGDKLAKLPCRINVAVSGLEWFVYNRSPVYESLLAGMMDQTKADDENAEKPRDSTSQPRQRLQKTSQKVEEQLKKLDSKLSSNEKDPGDSDGQRFASDTRRRSTSVSDDGRGTKSCNDEVPLMLQLLPLHFECDKAAVVMGNENTKAILIIKSRSLSGEIDASSCETPDSYRQLFKIRFNNPVVEMKENEDYKEDQPTRANMDKNIAVKRGNLPHRPFLQRQRRKALGQLRNLVPYWRSSVESFSVNSRNETVTAETPLPGAAHWQGLTRYLKDDDTDDKIRWSSIEYAAMPTLVDSSEAILTILWDVPGKVTRSHHSLVGDSKQRNNINGAAPPAWTINLQIKGGVINYGPWADRHRAELQRIFNPTLSKDATPAEKLPVGADRVPTEFKFYLEIDEEVTLRIPTREDSKNWRWKKEVAELRQHRKQERRRDKARTREELASNAVKQRPYGWLDIKVSPNATISYSMDMIAGATGYTNTLTVDLPSTEVSTSVNHGLLWKSGAQRISCDMSNPLKWNSLRNWLFNIEGDDLELFILRDHIFLLIDLIDDWGSGPPQDYLLFVPFKYFVNLQFRNLKLYLNVNDVNIVNSPTNFEENTYLVLSSPCLKADTCINLDVYRPPKNAVPFNVQADALALALHTPPWNTQATFLASKFIGQFESLKLDGNYHYNATTSPANTDTLVLNASGLSLMAHVHGFIVRYLLQLKDNYFGDYVHFKTLEEYQESLRVKESDPDAATANRPPTKKSNDLDVILGIRVDDPKLLLPANLYSARRHITIEGASLSVDLRFTNYYMDLDMSLSPLSLSLGSEDDGASSPMSATSSTQMYIDGLGVYGHRLFGLPPTEPTYMCNWDLSVGTVTGECTADFLNAIINGGKAFGFSLDDDENALIPYSSIVVYDVTFLRLSIQSIQLWLHVEEAAFLLSTGAIDVNYNDWARTHYSKRANIKVPDLQIACVNSESAARHHKMRLHSHVETDAILRTSIHFALIGRKYDFCNERRLQQELVRHEDQRTRRTDFLLLPGLLDDHTPNAVDVPAQSVPSVPQPKRSAYASDERKSMSSTGSSRRSRSLRHKNSFLSFSSESNGSVLRPGSLKSSKRLRSGGRQISDSIPHATNELKLPLNRRDYSASTGRHSAFYSAYGDYVDRRDLSHNTVAFSSQFFPPYFPLDNLRPDTKEAIMQSIEIQDDELPESSPFGLDDVDPDGLSQDSAYQSFIVELPAGVSAFLNATSLRYIAALMNALQPSEPDDILDSLQTSAMSEIFDKQKQQKIRGSINDFVVRIPQANVRFLNCSQLDSPEPFQEEQDQYDLSITKLAVNARSETLDTSSDAHTSLEPRLSFHFRLDSAEISAAERAAGLDETQAAVKARIERIMISMGSKELTYIDADVGALRVTSSSNKVEYLASLIHRTNMLATEMGALFSSTTSRGDQRVKHFTYRLMTDGHGAGDPSFIARPSAVLRAATEHLRTYDSWKLMARLRQMWNTLSEKEKEHLRLECLGSHAGYPMDARQQVTNAFQHWRSWDLDNIMDSILMNNIFGKLSSVGQLANGPTPSMAVVRIQETEFVLDPGPKQNQIFAMDVTARLETKTAQPTESESRSDTEVPLTVLNLYCADAGFNLNWELLELVEDVLRLYQRMEPRETEEVANQPPRTLKPEQPRMFHVVFALGRGSIALETVNLRSDTQSNDLKMSAVVVQRRQRLTGNNVILVCDSVTTKLRSHQQALATFRLRGASVFVSHELQLESQTSKHTIKSTASSEDLRLIVKQDPIVLAEVLDMLVRDEAAQLYSLQKQFPTSPEPGTQKQKITERLSTFRVDLAMFLNTYTISLPLLRSLTYTISGVVARAAMAANSGTEVIFDFDIKENSHDIQIKVGNAPRSISLLQIPPTNGRVTMQMGQGDRSISVFASVELIQLDASAVYSLLAALNRPEMSNAINDLQHQVKVIQEHLRETFDVQDSPKTKVPPQGTPRLVYIVHTTLAGIEIFGHAPTKSGSERQAHLSFCLDSIHLELANRLDQQGPVLENPEFRVNLRQIMFDVKKGSVEAMRSCGNLSFGALITGTTREADDGSEQRFFDFQSDGFEINLSADTISTFVDVLGYMGDKIKDLDTTKEIEYLQKRLRQNRPRIAINDEEEAEEVESDIFDSFLASIMYSVEIRDIQVSWLVAPGAARAASQEDLVLSLQRIEFATRQKNTAKLTIENFQLQMVPLEQDKALRSANSALLPEVIFNIAFVSTQDTRRLAFQAVGKSLDLRLTSGFIVPASNLADSIGLSVKNMQQASEKWTPIIAKEKSTEKQVDTRQRSLFGSKRVESVLVDADFAGAVVRLSSRRASTETDGIPSPHANRPALAGKYGQFSADDSGASTVLRSPGLAWKIEYRDDGKEDPAIYGEIKVDASENTICPTVVPLIMDISSSIKEVVSNDGKQSATRSVTPMNKSSESSKSKAKSGEEENILTTDPSAVLGRTKLNIGLRICKQEFTLSCQPIARVAASACFEDIYITVNTVHSLDHGNFFAISGTFSGLQASIQHVYSRESTGKFEVDSIVLSLMNSKHVSGTSGVSAILKVSPMKVDVNAKQLQDFLLFREIWVPHEIRQGSAAPVSKAPAELTAQGHLVQRYQQVAATAAFPWTATISISSLDVTVDLGQSLGKSVFAITDFWVSSKKTSDWEQNLCLGFQKIGIHCTGRLGGFVELQNFKLRTSIEWPERQAALNETPRIQASIGFSQFRLKAAFDYQAFLVADITSMDFIMYNVRRRREGTGDRLVASFDGDAVQVFGTTTSASQVVSLWQAVQRLIQERKSSYESSLRDIEKFMKRKSVTTQAPLLMPVRPDDSVGVIKSPISLDTDVVVTLKALNLGVFPSTFSDHQVFKLEALNAQARFAASMEQGRIHSILGLTLGQLRIGLASVRHVEAPKHVAEISVEDVIASATGSRGGTILKVPKVEAIMQTWQAPESRSIDYIFKSAFEGKVEVGWNYSRISYIRGMWANHSKMLASTWGRELPGMTAIKVTGVPEPSTSADIDNETDKNKDKEQQTKITAEVNVPQSKYEYVALEPPIIETPQLRDMGEATPPLEWIGLHRDRLPNLTHQIVIVSLLELAGEVEDAYASILGSS
ncbi:uncharacterized protein BCR38DRAFT_217683 [Pseudomassariella vexata]|uniref:Fermentation associated protein n=1 Tax=Pseudomassariella vexata TaxID=1141098 RepID=A0A1Y2DUH5_9PEZI|nr:uncharacterized protein BCR38DRAFT_217683 [Pseudomassariella vexata]ORY62930.1 hypothetical protein BCR38DRAFT_217683 [Pseudomassariella vexata]